MLVCTILEKNIKTQNLIDLYFWTEVLEKGEGALTQYGVCSYYFNQFIKLCKDGTLLIRVSPSITRLIFNQLIFIISQTCECSPH